jgi:hypothetical protein
MVLLAAIAKFWRAPAGEPVSLIVVHNISLPPDEFWRLGREILSQPA